MTVLTPEPEPYNSDPKDQPAPEVDFKKWLAAMVRYVTSEPGDLFTWDEIQESARVETEARLNEFSFQKNYGAVDSILDNPYEKYPDDLLAQTQGYTAKTHPLEVESDEDVARYRKEAK